MSIYIMSDIHGYCTGFESMLKKINLSPADHLYILGDAIDRGESSIGVLRKIMSSDNITLLMGNHELMMYEAYYSTPSDAQRRKIRLWYDNGGITTDTELDNIPTWERDYILEYISNLPVVIPHIQINDKNFYLSHSAYPANTPNDNKKSLYMDELSMQDLHQTVWKRVTDNTIHNFSQVNNDHILISGHTHASKYRKDEKDYIYISERYINIDCGCSKLSLGIGYGRLGCMRLDDFKEFYF